MREGCLQPHPLQCPGQGAWQWLMWSYLRAVAVHFEGIDAGLVPALSLQEGAIFCQLQAGTPKVAPLEYFDPVMLAMHPDGPAGAQVVAAPVPAVEVGVLSML